MKKYLILIILIALTLSAMFSIGCEKQRIKNELVQFDNDYWKISKELMYYDENFINDIRYLEEKDPNFANNNNTRKIINLIEDYQAEYEEYIGNFKEIHIPEPLDNFYYIKLDQFDSYWNSNKAYIQYCQVIINKNNYINEAIDNNYTEEKAMGVINNFNESRDNFYEDYGDYGDEGSDLYSRCNQLQREIYREYDLDNLIDKWQQ